MAVIVAMRIVVWNAAGSMGTLYTSIYAVTCIETLVLFSLYIFFVKFGKRNDKFWTFGLGFNSGVDLILAAHE